jgi:hypothetical protein
MTALLMAKPSTFSLVGARSLAYDVRPIQREQNSNAVGLH